MTGPLRISTIVLLSLIGGSGLARAQSTATPSSGADASSDANGSVSATGKRMPGIGESKSGAETPTEKKAEQQMNKDTTICKGC